MTRFTETEPMPARDSNGFTERELALEQELEWRADMERDEI